jgi:hypothetical protein
VLVGAAGYVLIGRDLIPDEIPFLGGLDDLAVVVLAVEIFFDGIPDEILEEKLDELGIDKDAFRRDIDQVRRLTRPRCGHHPPAARTQSMRQGGWSSNHQDRAAGSIVDHGRLSSRRNRSREGHPDRRRRQARQERRDEGCRRRLCPQLPDRPKTSPSRPPAAPIAPGSTTSPAARRSGSASAKTPRSRPPASAARR